VYIRIENMKKNFSIYHVPGPVTVSQVVLSKGPDVSY